MKREPRSRSGPARLTSSGLHIEAAPPATLNDPCGLCHWQGAYQLFFQYAPSAGAPKCWAWCRSEDLRSWEVLPLALEPELASERDGCFSGSALADDDGSLLLFYTGNVGDIDHDWRHATQHQLLAQLPAGERLSATRPMKASEALISGAPEGFTSHLRDPTPIDLGGGARGLLLGARDIRDRGQILLYASRGEAPYTYRGVFAGPLPGLGYMWECPDCFHLDGRAVLLLSPEGCEEVTGTVRSCGSLVGSLEGERFVPAAGSFFSVLDQGPDFYAARTLAAPDGRRLLWAWMGRPESAHLAPQRLCLPRELFFDSQGRLAQRPARELRALRRRPRTVNPAEGDGTILHLDDDVAGAELHLEMKVGRSLTLSGDGDMSPALCLEHHGAHLEVTIPHRAHRRCVASTSQTPLELQLFLAPGSLEIFEERGGLTLTTRLPELHAPRLRIDAPQEARRWDLAPCSFRPLAPG